MHLFRVIAYEHTKQKGRLLDSCCMFWRFATILMKSMTKTYIIYHLTKYGSSGHVRSWVHSINQ